MRGQIVACLHFAQYQGSGLSGMLIPTHMAADERDDSFVQVIAFDARFHIQLDSIHLDAPNVTRFTFISAVGLLNFDIRLNACSEFADDNLLNPGGSER